MVVPVERGMSSVSTSRPDRDRWGGVWGDEDAGNDYERDDEASGLKRRLTGDKMGRVGVGGVGVGIGVGGRGVRRGGKDESGGKNDDDDDDDDRRDRDRRDPSDDDDARSPSCPR